MSLRKYINLIEGKKAIVLPEDADQVRQQIDQKLQKIPDETDLRDVLKYTSRFSIKKDVTNFALLKNYKDLVSNTILSSLADNEIPEEEVKKFLQKLSTDGILNDDLLMTPRTVHRYEELIDNEYKKVFDKIKGDLFSKISGKIGEMGDVGKGEYMLDIICPNIKRRGAPGDLNIKGTNVELKAGDNGRLGPAGSMALVGRFEREFLPLIAQLVGKKKAAEFKNNPLPFNPTATKMGWWTEFFETPENLKTAVGALLKMHYPEGVNTKAIASKIVKGGQIDGRMLKAEMLKASFNVYKNAKEFDGIIIMDSAITKFLYIGSPEDIEAVADQLSVAFPSWTDTQSNAMKITLAGGTRAKAIELPDVPVDADGYMKPNKKWNTQMAKYGSDLASSRGIEDPELASKIADSAKEHILNGKSQSSLMAKLTKLYPELKVAKATSAGSTVTGTTTADLAPELSNSTVATTKKAPVEFNRQLK